jgi:hypothetical protein
MGDNLALTQGLFPFLVALSHGKLREVWQVVLSEIMVVLKCSLLH